MFGSDAPEQKAPSDPPGIPSKAHLEARGALLAGSGLGSLTPIVRIAWNRIWA
jgi:hypothetical protein